MYESQLDTWIPWLALGYGLTLLLLLEIPALNRFAAQRAPQILQMFQLHRNLAFVCLLVGAAWTLQNSLG